jgi:hypothetical protein
VIYIYVLTGGDLPGSATGIRFSNDIHETEELNVLYGGIQWASSRCGEFDKQKSPIFALNFSPNELA